MPGFIMKIIYSQMEVATWLVIEKKTQFHQYQQQKPPFPHHKPLDTKKTMTYGVGNPDFGLEQAQTCGRVKHCLCIFQHNMILFTVDKKNYWL